MIRLTGPKSLDENNRWVRLGRALVFLLNTKKSDFESMSGGVYGAWAYALKGPKYEIVYRSDHARLILRRLNTTHEVIRIYIGKKVWEEDEPWDLDYVATHGRRNKEADLWIASLLPPLDALALVGA